MQKLIYFYRNPVKRSYVKLINQSDEKVRESRTKEIRAENYSENQYIKKIIN